MNRFFKLLLLLFSLVIIATAAQAQVTVKGKVTDNKQKPVANASVTLKDTYDGATTDSMGNFSFSTTEKGAHLLVVTAINFRNAEQAITIANTSPLEVAILMKEEITELTAVMLTAGSFEASDRKRAAAVLTSLDVVTTASGNGDITGALKTLPGAQQVGETEGLFVRGGTAAETKIFIDGTLVNRFFLQ